MILNLTTGGNNLIINEKNNSETKAAEKQAITVQLFCSSDRKSRFFGIWKHVFLIFIMMILTSASSASA